MRNIKLFAVTAAGVTTLAMTASVAAQTLVGDGTIYGCKAAGTGVLRVVDAGVACLPTEAALSWNQMGPQGETGPAGARGEAGPAGPPGPISGYEARQALISVPAGAQQFLARVDCSSGRSALSGGYAPHGAPGALTVTAEYPLYNVMVGGSDYGIGWAAIVNNNTDQAVNINMRVICATTSS